MTCELLLNFERLKHLGNCPNHTLIPWGGGVVIRSSFSSIINYYVGFLFYSKLLLCCFTMFYKFWFLARATYAVL